MTKSKIETIKNFPNPVGTWTLLDLIGDGLYSEVYTAKHNKKNMMVAMKITDNIWDRKERLLHEIDILRHHSQHPNIIKFQGCFLKRRHLTLTAEDQLWFALEYCQGGSVSELARRVRDKGNRIRENIIAYIIRETMNALAFLHERNIIHRDIKGGNILLTSEAHVKLIDFDVSAMLKTSQQRRQSCTGTSYWVAPEVIACKSYANQQFEERSYDSRCDTWSLGITAIELADGKPPFAEQHPDRAMYKILRSVPSTVKEPTLWRADFNDFIKCKVTTELGDKTFSAFRCLAKNADKRPFIQDLFAHPLIKDVPEKPVVIRQQLQNLMKDVGCLSGPITQNVADVEANITSRMLKKNRNQFFNYSINDLAKLEDLNEDSLLSHLISRYNMGQIYTYIGDILIAVNPFKPLKIYNDEYSNRYRSADITKHDPHIYAIASATYNDLIINKRNQCCIISGESGAGKTVSAGFLVQHLTKLGNATTRALEQKILQVNPLLEAFGNAQTLFNDNSSRFGKYLEMKFADDGTVTGAQLSQFLLEKSRIVSQANEERNFHILYYILYGFQFNKIAKKYHLPENPEAAIFQYLPYHKSDTTKAIKTRYIDKFREVQECFHVIGFSKEELDNTFSILAAVLQIGDIDFLRDQSNEHLIERSLIKNNEKLCVVAKLLSVNAEDIEDALIRNTTAAAGEVIVMNNTVTKATECRDAMAKALYGRLFAWIVDRINNLLKPDSHYDRLYNIGILDIFGFEKFDKNSFEQLCINIANEQIQYFFNRHIFSLEQEEYVTEGINLDTVSFKDNKPVLDMFLNRRNGLLTILDDETVLTTSSTRTLVDKLHEGLAKNEYYLQPRDNSASFAIFHYAAKVIYDASLFLFKNRDTLQQDIVQLLSTSGNVLLQSFFQDNGTFSAHPSTKTTYIPRKNANLLSINDNSDQFRSLPYPKGRPRSGSNTHSKLTVASYFRNSLAELLSKMTEAQPHFVRCIKPNSRNEADNFDQDRVLTQLTYTGVIETTNIRRQGFPNRISFTDFMARYQSLGFSATRKVQPTSDNCEKILKACKIEDFAIGKTKVFLRYYHIQQLAKQFEKQHQYAVIIQKEIKGWVARRRFKRILRNVLVLQKTIRGWLAWVKYSRVKTFRSNCAIKIQAAVKGWLARIHHKQWMETANESAIVIQKFIRGWLERVKYWRKTRKNVVQKNRWNVRKSAVVLPSEKQLPANNKLSRPMTNDNLQERQSMRSNGLNAHGRSKQPSIGLSAHNIRSKRRKQPFSTDNPYERYYIKVTNWDAPNVINENGDLSSPGLLRSSRKREERIQRMFATLTYYNIISANRI
ncbi:Myosin-IIIa [Trichoplax sp. H2]|nr:Myosin-IIIa [Trichoplax sp. H2]|eukprot:RDD46335.1 Myosin-IIIa [Trichoplax sp. H2]